MSLCKPLEPHHLKYNLKDLPPNKKHFSEVNSAVSPDTNTFIFNQSPASSTGSLDRTLTPVKHSSSTPISSPVTVCITIYFFDLEKLLTQFEVNKNFKSHCIYSSGYCLIIIDAIVFYITHIFSKFSCKIRSSVV